MSGLFAIDPRGQPYWDCYPNGMASARFTGPIIGMGPSEPGLAKAPMDKLAKHLADLYFRITTTPRDGPYLDARTLDCIEQIAIEIQNEVRAARLAGSREIGEVSGTWRAMPPVRRS